jgi:heme-degrading monooxygenase HmoA
MYITISEAAVADVGKTKTRVARVHEFMAEIPGFRWAMALRSLETPDNLVAVSMWLTPEQASHQESVSLDADEVTREFDVATARGTMTPASHVAVVEWEVPNDVEARFTNRWNAAYHAIEDSIGSRLLRNLDAPGRYAGLHAVTNEASLNPDTLGATLSDAEGLSISPLAVHRYEVLVLTGG